MSRTTCVLACLVLLAACSEGTDVGTVETPEAPAARESARTEPLAREATPGGEAPPANAPAEETGEVVVADTTSTTECASTTWSHHTNSPSWPQNAASSKTDHHSGVALVDVTGDDLEDLVVSSGNDIVPEVVEAFYNDGTATVFPTLRDWYAGREAFYGKFAVGNIDADKCNEVVTSVFFGRTDKKMNRGGLVKFDSAVNADGDCELAAIPIRIEQGANRFTAPSVAFADVNGDAHLDVVVAIATDKNKKFPPANYDDLDEGAFSRVYLGDGSGNFALVPAWKDPGKKYRAGDVEFADLDGDGYGDLVFATRQYPRIFWGEEPAPSNHQTGVKKRACSKDVTNPFKKDLSFSVDAIRIGNKGYVAHVSADARNVSEDGTSYVPVYRKFKVYEVWKPEDDADPCFDESDKKKFWESESAGRPSVVAWGDLLGSGAPYLVAGRWGDEGEGKAEAGSLVRIYKWTTPSGSDLSFSLEACLGDRGAEPVVNGVAFADLDDSGLVQGVSGEITVPDNGRLITLDRHLIEDIVKVEWDDGGEWKDLDPGEYASVPGENWVSFSEAAKGKKVKIHFRTSSHWDIAYGDFHDNAWPRVHFWKP